MTFALCDPLRDGERRQRSAVRHRPLGHGGAWSGHRSGVRRRRADDVPRGVRVRDLLRDVAQGAVPRGVLQQGRPAHRHRLRRRLHQDPGYGAHAGQERHAHRGGTTEPTRVFFAVREPAVTVLLFTAAD